MTTQIGPLEVDKLTSDRFRVYNTITEVAHVAIGKEEDVMPRLRRLAIKVAKRDQTGIWSRVAKMTWRTLAVAPKSEEKSFPKWKGGEES